jgi:hypothetical protein
VVGPMLHGGDGGFVVPYAVSGSPAHRSMALMLQGFKTVSPGLTSRRIRQFFAVQSLETSSPERR